MCAWSGGNYTKGNAATGGWTGDASLGIGIEAGRHDTQDNDFATGINQCLNKDGSNAATGNLNLGGNKLTNIGAATARTDAVQTAQVQDGSFVWCGTSGGSANAQTLTPSPAITAYAAGQRFRFIAGFTPTGTYTINVSGLGAKNVKNVAGSNEGIVDLYKGRMYELVYDGTNFRHASERGFADFNAGATGENLNFYKSRGAEYPTNTLPASGDGCNLNWWGANGTGYDRYAYISGIVDGTPGASNDMPGALLFATTADGSASTTERMRITSAGRVGIGTSNPSSYVTILNASSAINTLNVQSNASGDVGTHALAIIKYDNDSTSSQKLVSFFMNQGIAGQGQINANGAQQAAFASYSDERLKENIEDLPSQLANIFALRPVEFDYKNGSGHQIGFIAQEVQEIYPDLIGEEADGYLTLSGLGKNDARMIKAFQEFAELCNAKIAALEARLAELEAV